MKCPRCASSKTPKISGVYSADRAVRYRVCRNCALRFKTIEICAPTNRPEQFDKERADRLNDNLAADRVAFLLDPNRH